MEKEKHLCQAVGMASDLPTLLRKAIKGYEDEDLKPKGDRCLMNMKLLLHEIEKTTRLFEGALEEMYEMSGLDIMEIGYDD